jgi:hypothetical protein
VQPTAVQLRDEIVADPAGLGYKVGVWKQDSEIEELINRERGGEEFLVDRDAVPSGVIFDLIVPSEYITLTIERLRWLSDLLHRQDVNLNSVNVRAGLQLCFGAGTATRAAIAAYYKRPASRAESLWGAGVRVSNTEIAAARAVGA